MDYTDNRDCIVTKYIYRDYREIILTPNTEINPVFQYFKQET